MRGVKFDEECRLYPLSPEHMNKRTREAFVREHAEAIITYFCVHRHVGCSIEPRGPCLDEVLNFMKGNGEI